VVEEGEEICYIEILLARIFQTDVARELGDERYVASFKTAKPASTITSRPL
jgi:hypothetical protein